MAMLRVHLMQNGFCYSDPAMEEALYETTILRQSARLSLEHIPDETTILNFRRLLEKHELAAGTLAVINGYLGDRGLSLRQDTIVDATLINAPSSTKNKDGKRDPEMYQTKKGQQYYFGITAHIGMDAESGLVHSGGDGGQRGGCHSGRQTAALRGKHGWWRRWLHRRRKTP
jgi:IS5 family transposase